MRRISRQAAPRHLLRASLVALLVVPAAPGAASPSEPAAEILTQLEGGPAVVAKDDGYHVHPGADIQEALDRAALDPQRKRVVVHAGTYRPASRAEAMVRFNARHDGITLEAAGSVLLTAENPDLADPEARSFPAVVNHVVYFGDGISRRTILRGFRITGSRDFYSDAGDDLPPVEPSLDRVAKLHDHQFFHSDGGAIKVFGRSYPVIENVEIHDNFSDPCGGGISIEHRGYMDDAVRIRDSIFRDNRSAETGAAIDVLPYSTAIIENCVFVGNISNAGPLAGLPVDGAQFSTSFNRAHGSGALTVFPGSRVEVRRSTFTGNWNGVDDRGLGSVYEDNIFWMNTAGGGIAPAGRYELDIMDGRGVRGCHIRGATDDLRHSVNPDTNVLGAADPRFDETYRPHAESYAGVGYRPNPGVEHTRDERSDP